MIPRSATFSLGWLAALTVAFWSLSAQVGKAAAEDRGRPSPSATKNGVLVELFTSQGCSSCPPADRFLSELAARADLEVIPLSFHVDYWNYIGWTDPFSSPEWSDRQRRYAQAFGGDRIYTPQIVVDGRWEGVGSQRQEISRLIERARARSSNAEIDLAAEPVSADEVRIAISAHGFDPEFESDSLATWVALVESDLLTEVGRGENAAKSLRNDRVVRHLERVSMLESGEPGRFVASVDLPVDGGWRRDRLSVVAFVQDDESLRVDAAAELGLAR